LHGHSQGFRGQQAHTRRIRNGFRANTSPVGRAPHARNFSVRSHAWAVGAKFPRDWSAVGRPVFRLRTRACPQRRFKVKRIIYGNPMGANLALTALLTLGCAEGGDDPADGATSTMDSTSGGPSTSGGANGTTNSTTSSASDTTSSTSSGGSTSDGNNGSADSTATMTSGAGGNAGSGGSSGTYAHTGVCSLRSQGTVTVDSFESYEEHVLLGDEGFGEEVCVVHYDVTRVGVAPGGCDEFAGQQDECLWTHLVEYSNPRVLVDVDGACANSELGMDQAAMDAIDGTQIAYGYVFEYQGHSSALMAHDPEQDVWAPLLYAG